MRHGSEISTPSAAALGALFLPPFLVLAAVYRDLPQNVGVIRIWVAHTSLWAAKSLFIVFRVPAMNLIHGLLASVMLSRSGDFENEGRRTAYRKAFLILLMAIGLKANFESLEAVPPSVFGPWGNWFGFGALTSIFVGLSAAFYTARKVPLPWSELRLSFVNKLALGVLAGAYLAIVAASILVSHRVTPGRVVP